MRPALGQARFALLGVLGETERRAPGRMGVFRQAVCKDVWYRKMTYSEKLKDPRWQKKRLEILEAAQWECSSCGDKETTLHVHHKRYHKGLEPWDYGNHELECLCEDCHRRVSELDKSLTFDISLLGEGDKLALAGYVDALLRMEVWGTPEAKNETEADVKFKSCEYMSGIGDYFGISEDKLIEIAQKNEGWIPFAELYEARRKKYAK